MKTKKRNQAMPRTPQALILKRVVLIAALLLVALAPAGVQAAISLDPTIDPIDPGLNPVYKQDRIGGTAISGGGRLTLNRTNPAKKLAFFRWEDSANGAVIVEI